MKVGKLFELNNSNTRFGGGGEAKQEKQASRSRAVCWNNGTDQQLQTVHRHTDRFRENGVSQYFMLQVGMQTGQNDTERTFALDCSLLLLKVSHDQRISSSWAKSAPNRSSKGDPTVDRPYRGGAHGLLLLRRKILLPRKIEFCKPKSKSVSKQL